MNNAGELFDDDKWAEVVLSIKEAVDETFPEFTFIFNKDSSFANHEDDLTEGRDEESSESTKQAEDLEKRMKDRFVTAISSVRCRAVVQLLLIQVTISCFLLRVLLILLYMLQMPTAVLNPISLRIKWK